MGLLTTAQKDAIARGARIRQVWSIGVPGSAGSTSYTWNTIHDDDGDETSVIDAGRRRNTAYNVSIMSPGEFSAATYEIVVDNNDGSFYPGSSNSHFTKILMPPYAADPRECLLKHQVYVWDGSAWSELPCSPWLGRIVEVTYEEQVRADGTAFSKTATIRSEGWLGEILRQPWTEEHTASGGMELYTPSGKLFVSGDRGHDTDSGQIRIWAQATTNVTCNSTLTMHVSGASFGLAGTNYTLNTTGATTHQVSQNIGSSVAWYSVTFTWKFTASGAGNSIVVKHPDILILYSAETATARPW